jgi:fructose-1,6-bisphosphatase/inositol monophosphatase family enzyme
MIRITDVAAGLCILREAGGAIHLVGESLDSIELTREKRLSLVASANPALMKEILGVLDLGVAQ